MIFDDKNGFNVNVANKLNLSGRKGGEDNDGGKKEKKRIVRSNQYKYQINDHQSQLYK